MTQTVHRTWGPVEGPLQVQVLSDLHMDTHPLGTLRKHAPMATGADLTVVAGDLCEAPRLIEKVDRLLKVHPRVVYIPGNHDYWRADREEVLATLDHLAQTRPGFVPLQAGRRLEIRDPTKLHLWKIIGATLWFPASMDNVLGAKHWCDFGYVRDLRDWVFRQNEEDARWLTSEPADLVLSHHMPGWGFVHDQYKHSKDNGYFVGIDKATPRLTPAVPGATWVFGHTHHAIDETFGAFRYVCNPFGYPGEARHKRGFDKNKLLLLPPGLAQKS